MLWPVWSVQSPAPQSPTTQVEVQRSVRASQSAPPRPVRVHNLAIRPVVSGHGQVACEQYAHLMRYHIVPGRPNHAVRVPGGDVPLPELTLIAHASLANQPRGGLRALRYPPDERDHPVICGRLKRKTLQGCAMPEATVLLCLADSVTGGAKLDRQDCHTRQPCAIDPPLAIQL